MSNSTLCIFEITVYDHYLIHSKAVGASQLIKLLGFKLVLSTSHACLTGTQNRPRKVLV